MAGATGYAGGLTFAVQKAIEAGNNIIESSRTPLLNEHVWTHNLNLMKRERDFYITVRNSCKRLLIFKLKYFKNTSHVPIFPDIENITNILPLKEAQDFFVGMAARSVTIIRADGGIFVNAETEKPLIVSSSEAFLNAGKQRFSSAILSNLEDAKDKVKYAKRIIFCLDDYDSLEVLKQLSVLFPKKQYIVVSSLSPIYLQHIPSVKNVLAIYSSSPFSYMAVFSCIAGDFKAFGTMPLKDIK